MKPIYVAFVASLLAMSFAASGCMEGAQDFELHGDGSGVLTIKVKIGKEFSEMTAKSFEGKTPAELNAEAYAKMSKDFRGVYFESASRKVVDGQVVIEATGVFADIRQVKMIQTKNRMVDGQPKKVREEQLRFTFEQNAEGGTLSMKLDAGKDAPGRKKKGAEDEGDGRSKKEKAQLEAMFAQMFKELKFRVSVRPPGKIERNGLMDLGENRAGFELNLKVLQDKVIEKGLSTMDGAITWKGNTATPKGFAERLAKARAKAEKAAKEPAAKTTEKR
jgi:hypothetical protein